MRNVGKNITAVFHVPSSLFTLKNIAFQKENKVETKCDTWRVNKRREKKDCYVWLSVSLPCSALVNLRTITTRDQREKRTQSIFTRRLPRSDVGDECSEENENIALPKWLAR